MIFQYMNSKKCLNGYSLTSKHDLVYFCTYEPAHTHTHTHTHTYNIYIYIYVYIHKSYI